MPGGGERVADVDAEPMRRRVDVVGVPRDQRRHVHVEPAAARRTAVGMNRDRDVGVRPVAEAGALVDARSPAVVGRA